MITLKEKYKKYKQYIEKHNFSSDDFLLDWFDGQDNALKDENNNNVYYILSCFSGWYYYDTCIKVCSENAEIGFFNDQKNIFKPLYKINNKNWCLAMHETLENMDVMDSIKLKTNDELMEV